MLKPLLLIFGVVAVVGSLMLGGWALTNVTPDVPSKPAPPAGSDAEATGGSAAKAGSTDRQAQRTGQGSQAYERARAEALRENAARARNVQARRVRRSAGGPKHDDSERAKRNGSEEAQPLRAERAAEAQERRQADVEQGREAEERRRADAARRSGERLRAEQVRQADAARQAEAARQAAAAKRAADQTPDEQGADDGPEDE